MLELEDQLRRYGEALEHDLLEDADLTLASMEVSPPTGRRVVAVAAALALLAGVAVSILAIVGDDRDSAVTTDSAQLREGHAGVFSTPTNAVLLFSDGIDGATAIDLDQRLAGRRAVEGERPGDQQYRLTLTGEHLVVGWGEVYAAPLHGGPSQKVADATIYLPASEEGSVWTLSWEGGRIGAGAATLRRVEIDGTTVFESDTFDPATLEPVQGVPGGLMVNTPNGVAVWDAATETTGPVLGPGRAVAATTDGRVVAWCADTCVEVHIAPLARTGAPTARHVAPGAQQIALSHDGSILAFLRPHGDRAELVVTTMSASVEEVVADDLDVRGALVWSPDGRQLFYTENSYDTASMRVGRYDREAKRWQIERIPVAAGFAPIAVTHDEAQSFFADNPVPENECQTGGTSSSGPYDPCTFTYFTPDSPDDCAAAGPRTVEVPDAVGLPLREAAIRMQIAGLSVVGSGPEGGGELSEPDALVHAHEPPPGANVPVGACVGFRTAPR